MKVLILLVCAIAFVRAVSLEEEFASFMTTFQRVYTPEELVIRKEIFRANKRRAMELQQSADSRGENTQYGITKFSDMTPEEFKNKFLGFKRQKSDVIHPVFNEFVSDIPTSFDWRSKGNVVTPVKNQEQCGSCWAFSATEGIESAWALAKSTQVILSAQQIVSCDKSDGGCDGGDLPTAFDYVKKSGQETEKDYPYTSGNGVTGKCKFQQTLVAAKITGFAYATQSRNETAMQAAMITKGPLSICVDAETWQTYTGGIIKSNCARDLDHCVQVVGWDTNQVPYWIVRNSWGTDWGLDGYLYVERNKDLCGIADEATYVTV